MKPGRHPLHVKWHGGGLISSDALLQDWFSNYFDPFTDCTSFIVLPNYRCISELSGAETHEDIRDFWTWANRDLARVLQNAAPPIEMDIDQLLVSDDSPGGLHALYLVFDLPEGRIKALLSFYSMVKKWCKSEELMREWSRPTPDEEMIDKYLVQVPERCVVSTV
ncbi:uncharacterized protein M421DRAFT_418832 [Didymella exigua CBS 183.55]|uniref:Uncharacterized protein n=1 Tax=Didymella exigua CBS 183.55 TaxID=1150837 RepID=A0A6A5RZ48_9PLEO|nr:uncharacterized protein M421DRAFT_418832 [Didymella exigua CBS 183.55]KAF1930527.1 hypothetical protein M421DRAFT_418832 [Didymella exigua CBS 183.55]